MQQQQATLVLPGNEIQIKRKSEAANARDIVIGPGLRKDVEDTIVAVKCGILKKKENFFWLESHQKRVIAMQRNN
jgi:hypothetical protein